MYINLDKIDLPDNFEVHISDFIFKGSKTVYVYIDGKLHKEYRHLKGSNKQIITKLEKYYKEKLILQTLKDAGLLP